MKIFSKISASRTLVNEKSVNIGGLYFNKSEMFTKNDMDEVVKFVKNKFQELLGGGTYHINSLLHLFNNNSLAAKKFMYILSCLRDKKGNSLFKLFQENGLIAIKIVTPHVIITGKDEKKEIKSTDDEKVADTLKAKFNLKELRKIVDGIDGTRYVKKMKEKKLVELILENKSEDEIKDLLM